MHINDSQNLAIDEGENIHFELIAADPANYDSDATHKLSNPAFIIMHYTGGLKMESTINTFKNPPKDPSQAASAHLLVGRDGSVVQFMRFDQVAYHTGYAWWEQQTHLNYCSIGIELDNVGELVRKDNQWHPRHMDDVTIPDGEVQQSEYWKSPLPSGNRGDPDYMSRLPGYQKFTDVQLAVALDIIRTLVKTYPSIQEILGHDQINIAYRTDPGPLLPMSAWRQELFGRQEPVIEEYLLTQSTDLYANVDGNLPNTDQSTFAKPLPAKSVVKVLSFQDVGGLTRVKVVKLPAKATGVAGIGWVRSSSLQALPPNPKKKNSQAGDQRTTSFDQTFFRAGGNAPTLKVGQGPLGVNTGLVFQAGTRVRIQEFRGDWALVALLDRINGHGLADNNHGQGGLEGWVHKDLLARKDA
ncbi:MAG: N-acetylmuramoyl-L-alanine amidase [Bacteroidota bacterium]